MVEVLVGGAGPAGWAVAAACARAGLGTALVAPRPYAEWPTYGMWADEVGHLPAGTRYVTARARVFTDEWRWLERGYAVLDSESLRRALTHPEVEIREGRLEDFPDATVVIDATGAHGPRPHVSVPQRPAVTIGRPPAPRASRDAEATGGARVEQSAFGVVVSAEVAAPLVPAGEAIFMDWRQPVDGPVTFLYAVPLPDGRVLLEETSLAARPAVPMAELRSRLLTRLAHHGITPPTDAPIDRVRIPLDQPRPDQAKRGSTRGWPTPTRPRGAPLMPVYRGTPTEPGRARGLWTTPGSERRVPFGAAAGLVHPASGFSVADSLRLAPLVARAVRGGGADAALAVMWSPGARAVDRLRRAGLAALLALPAGRTVEFFDLFFQLPVARQRAFLSERDNLAGTAAAMATMFRRASWPLRRAMVTFRE